MGHCGSEADPFEGAELHSHTIRSAAVKYALKERTEELWLWLHLAGVRSEGVALAALFEQPG